MLRASSELTPLAATVDQLKEAGIASDGLLGVVVTHAHWDHVSGLADLSQVPVYMTEEDQLFATEDIEMGKLFTELRAEHDLEIKNLSFEDGQHGPFLSSHDFFRMARS